MIPENVFHFVNDCFLIPTHRNFSNQDFMEIIDFIFNSNECYLSLLYAESSIDRPLATYRPRDQFVHIGDHARFYCEAFIGNLGIPDAKSTLKWYQVFDKDTEQEIKDGYQDLITR